MHLLEVHRCTFLVAFKVNSGVVVAFRQIFQKHVLVRCGKHLGIELIILVLQLPAAVTPVLCQLVAQLPHGQINGEDIVKVVVVVIGLAVPLHSAGGFLILICGGFKACRADISRHLVVNAEVDQILPAVVSCVEPVR